MDFLQTILATPAIFENIIYYRTQGHLIAIAPTAK